LVGVAGRLYNKYVGEKESIEPQNARVVLQCTPVVAAFMIRDPRTIVIQLSKEERELKFWGNLLKRRGEMVW
jgi:hypothetical protein